MAKKLKKGFAESLMMRTIGMTGRETLSDLSAKPKRYIPKYNPEVLISASMIIAEDKYKMMAEAYSEKLIRQRLKARGEGVEIFNRLVKKDADKNTALNKASVKLMNALSDVWRQTGRMFNSSIKETKKNIQDLFNFYEKLNAIDVKTLEEKEITVVTIGDYEKSKLAEKGAKAAGLDITKLKKLLEKKNVKFTDVAPILEQMDSKALQMTWSLMKPLENVSDRYEVLGKMFKHSKITLPEGNFIQILFKGLDVDLSELNKIPGIGKLFENINSLPEYKKYLEYLKKNKKTLMTLKRETMKFKNSSELLNFVKKDILKCINIMAAIYSVASYNYNKHTVLSNVLDDYRASVDFSDDYDGSVIMRKLVHTSNDVDKYERQIYNILSDMNIKMVKEKMKIYSSLIKNAKK